ncbi:hypothetical protein DFQ27_001168, partial [Actinomortierella ambigua]
HAIKTSIHASLYSLLENDFIDVVGYTVGGTVLLVLEFFLGSSIASALKFVFRTHCSVVNYFFGVPPLKRPPPTEHKAPYDGEYHHSHLSVPPGYEDHYGKKKGPKGDQRRTIMIDDYSPLKPTCPSYMTLVRLLLAYCFLRLTTADQRQLVFEAIQSTHIDTRELLWKYACFFLLHAFVINVHNWITLFEMWFSPGVNHIVVAERSIRIRVSRGLRKSMQYHLHWFLSALLSLMVVVGLGLLAGVFASGVLHDVYGGLLQTHAYVTKVQGHPNHAAANGFMNYMDRSLVDAYNSGTQWLEPLVMDAFPDVGWTPQEWALQVAKVVVTVDPCNPLLVENLDETNAHIGDKDDYVARADEPYHHTDDYYRTADDYQHVADDYHRMTGDRHLETNGILPPPESDNGDDAWVVVDDYHEYMSTSTDETTGSSTQTFPSPPTPVPQSPARLYYIPLSWNAFKTKLADPNNLTPPVTDCSASRANAERRVAINLTQIQYLLSVLLTHREFSHEMLPHKMYWCGDFVVKFILFILTLMTLTGLT